MNKKLFFLTLIIAASMIITACGGTTTPAAQATPRPLPTATLEIPHIPSPTPTPEPEVARVLQDFCGGRTTMSRDGHVYYVRSGSAIVNDVEYDCDEYKGEFEFPTPSTPEPEMARYCEGEYETSLGTTLTYRLAAEEQKTFYLGLDHYARMLCNQAAQGAEVEEFVSDRPRPETLNKVAMYCAASPDSKVDYDGIAFDCRFLHPYGFQMFTVNIRPEGALGRTDWLSDAADVFVSGCSIPLGIREEPANTAHDILIMLEGYGGPSILWIEAEDTTPGFECRLLGDLVAGQKYQFWNNLRPEPIEFYGVAANGTIQNGTTLEFVRVDGGRIYVLYQGAEVWLSNDVVWFGVPAP